VSDITHLEPRHRAEAWLKTLDELLTEYNFNFTSEAELQDGIMQVFQTLDEPFTSECIISKEDRIDFYWPGPGVGVEVKIKHSLSALTRQVHRYLQHESVKGILIVSGKSRLNELPQIISGKPVLIHSLIGSLL
jgi:hypothetical protein